MKTQNLKLATTALAVAVASFQASAIQIGGPPVDSTRVPHGATSTLVIPTGLSTTDVLNINCQVNGGTVVTGGGCTYSGNTTPSNPAESGGPPAGYTEISVPMGPHSIGTGDGTYGLTYYLGLGYGVVQTSPGYGGNGWPSNPCQGNLSPRIIFSPAQVCNEGESGCTGGTPPSYWVCEQSGTRTTLQKVVGAQVLNVTRPTIDTFKIPPSVGLSTQAATRVCQGLGYTNYVAGSVVSTQPFTCGYSITRVNASNNFYTDNACYNPVLQSMQCWR